MAEIAGVIHHYGTVSSSASGKVRLALSANQELIASVEPDGSIIQFGWDHDSAREQFQLKDGRATVKVNGQFLTFVAVDVTGF